MGTFDGADWETFGEVREVGFDGAGNLYVMDAQSSRMIVVDRNGEFVRMFGNRGEGPGEWGGSISGCSLQMAESLTSTTTGLPRTSKTAKDPGSWTGKWD